jgi:hypothetical protein
MRIIAVKYQLKASWEMVGKMWDKNAKDREAIMLK